MIKETPQQQQQQNKQGLPVASSAADTALSAVLQSELLVLSNETRRKQPNVKIILDRILSELRSSVALQTCLQQNCVDLVTALLNACTGPAASRCTAPAINIVFRLSSSRPLSISAECLADMLQIIEHGATASERDGGGEDVQLRCLQAAIPLWQHYGEGLLHEQGRLALTLYSVCIRLCGAPLGVGNAAIAITRQLLVDLFERAVEGVQDDEPVDDNDGDGRDAGSTSATARLVLDQVIVDVCSWLSGQPAVNIVLPGPATIPSLLFVLELWEGLLQQQAPLVASLPEIVALLREQACPVLVRRLSDPQADFGLAVRLWRVVLVLLGQYPDLLPVECEIFLSLMTRTLLEDAESDLARLLVLETINELLESTTCQHLFTLSGSLPGSESPAFTDLLRALFRTALDQITDLAMAQQGNTAPLSLESSSIRTPLLSCFVDRNQPSGGVPASYSLFLLFSALQKLTGLVGTQQLEASASTVLQANGRAMAEIVDRLGSGIRLDARWRQASFTLFQEWAIIAAKTAASGDCLDRALEAMAVIAYSIADNRPDDASPSLMAAGAVIDIAGHVGNQLSPSNWVLVVRTIQAIDVCLLAGGGAGTDLKDRTDSLLAQSKTLSIESFIDVQSAIKDVIGECTNNPDLDMSVRLLPTGRLKQISDDGQLYAGSPAAWTGLSDGLAVLVGCPESALRQAGCDIAASCTLNYYLLCDGDDQVRGLALLQRLIADGAGWADSYKAAVETLHRLVSQHGDGLGMASWISILQGCTAVLDAAPSARGIEMPELFLLRCVFSLLRLIGSDFIGSLVTAESDTALPTLTLFVGLLGRIARSRASSDLNLSLAAIGQLWDVADAAVTCHSPAGWMVVLGELAAGAADPRCEVRNSCVQTVFRTVEVHARELGADWQAVFERIIGRLCALVDDCYAQILEAETSDMMICQGDELLAHHTRNTEAKLWDETIVLILQGMTQVVREHLAKIVDIVPIWSQFTDRLTLAVTGSRRPEVVAVGMTCLQAIIASSSIGQTTWPHWEGVWTSLVDDVPSHMDNCPECFDQSTLHAHLQCISTLLARFSSDRIVSQGNYSMVGAAFQAIQRAVLHPPSPDDRVHDCDAPSQLQRAALDWLGSESILTLYAQVPASRAALLELTANVLVAAAAVPDQSIELCGSLTPWARRQHRPVLGDTRSGEEEDQHHHHRRDFSRVALCQALMEDCLQGKLVSWLGGSDDHDDTDSALLLWQCGAVRQVLLALTRWAGDLKYRAPRHRAPNLAAPWRTATETLLQIIQSGVAVLRDEEGFWQLVAESLATVLRNAVIAVPWDISAEQLESDEDIDRQTLSFIDGLLIADGPSSIPEGPAELLLDAVCDASRLYNCITDSRNILLAPAHSIDNTEPVVKARLAADSLLLLFRHDRARSFLLRRVSGALDSFLETQRCLGLVSAPQYSSTHTHTSMPNFTIFRTRQEELLFLMDKMLGCDDLIKANYRPLVHLLTTPGIPRAVASRAEQLLLQLRF